MKPVTEEEFDAFLAAYPRPLERNVAAMCEPLYVSFNDFTIAPQWPQSIVASYFLDGHDRTTFRIKE